jgi:hypothetical protein
MGNNQSGEKKEKELEGHNYKKLNLNCIIATYMMDMDIEDMQTLLDLDYCNKLVLLISKILNQHISNNEMKELVKKIDSSIKSKYALELSKFYVKIWHLFSIILTTINENKSFKEIVNLDQRGYMDQEYDQYGGSRIPEFIDLYNDSGYDLDSGNFLSMTPETKTRFNNDLNQFYIVFTQNKEMPNSITKFSDIPFELSKEEEEDRFDPFKNNISEYANNLKKILLSIEKVHKKLLIILNKIFEINEDNRGQLCLNSTLTENKIQELIDETRNIIIEFYLNYDEDYLQNAKLYESIVLSHIIETTKNQLKTLEEEKLNLFMPDYKQL